MKAHSKAGWLAVWGVVLAAAMAQAFPITILSDDFDDKDTVPGTLLEAPNNVPQNGTLWESPNFPDADVWVQDDYAASGNAVNLTRPDSVGARQLILGSTNANNQVEANTEAVFKFDFFRLDTSGGTVVDLNIGGTASARVYSHIQNLRWYYWDYDEGGWEMEGFSNANIGTNGWGTIEMVVTWGEVNGDGKLQGSYDVYHSRTAENSAGELERTLLVGNVQLPGDVYEPGQAYSITFAPQQVSPNPSIMYIDNVNLTVIPEPSMAALLAGGLAVLWYKRRR